MTTQMQYPALSDCYEETISPVTTRLPTISQTNTTNHEALSTTKMTSEIPSAMTSLEYLLRPQKETQQQQWQTQDFIDSFMR